MPKSAAAFWADLLSHVKGGTSFASSDPPWGSGGAGAHQCLGLAWDGGRGGKPVHPASGAETPGHIGNWMFTAHHKHLSLSPALSCNYAVLSDVSGAVGTQAARALPPDVTELPGFL